MYRAQLQKLVTWARRHPTSLLSSRSALSFGSVLSLGSALSILSISSRGGFIPYQHTLSIVELH